MSLLENLIIFERLPSTEKLVEARLSVSRYLTNVFYTSTFRWGAVKKKHPLVDDLATSMLVRDTKPAGEKIKKIDRIIN